MMPEASPDPPGWSKQYGDSARAKMTLTTRLVIAMIMLVTIAGRDDPQGARGLSARDSHRSRQNHLR
jgi:hypothetical protein